MSSIDSYAFGMALGGLVEQWKHKENASDYVHYVNKREKFINEKYHDYQAYVDIFTTDSANEQIFKLYPIVTVGISVDDANIQLMQQALKNECDTVIGVQYEFNSHDFGTEVIATGTCATTSQEKYNNVKAAKIQRRQEVDKLNLVNKEIEEKIKNISDPKELLELSVQPYLEKGYYEKNRIGNQRITLGLENSFSEITVTLDQKTMIVTVKDQDGNEL